ncbi:MAG: hypothetical protein ABJB97_08775, partial [Acidobacteriota bacterium]
NFCLEDGTPLVGDAPRVIDLHATVREAPARITSDPPPTEIYRPGTPVMNQVAGINQARPGGQQWSPVQATQPRKKSSAIWWVLGIVAVLTVIGIGVVIMVLALASMSTNQNAGNTNTNSRVTTANRNSNANTVANTASENTNGNSNNNVSPDLPSSVVDDFSGDKWKTGNFQYGDIWYADDQYHMRSKEKTYLVMYAPDSEYNTENAAVSVTARSVDGTSPSSGYGLIVHGEKSKDNQLEDYALLVYTGSEPQYEVVMHTDGNQTTLVPWTKTTVLRSGTNPNQLEIRTKGDELSFHINGRFLTRITDKETFKRGVAGLYTSETPEVVFDDLEIRR